MKKFIIIMTGLIMISIMMQASGVSRYEALEKARRFMPDKKFKQEEGNQRKVSGIGFTNSPYYVFNAENNSGFVIVSGDDRIEAILGYADHGELNVENAPDNVKWLLDYYDKVITAMGEPTKINDKKQSDRRKTMVSVTNRIRIEPLLKTQWNQMDPYNKYCPEWVGKGVRYPAGCVATAMAQVINYHQWPKGNTGDVKRYVSVTNSIDMPALPSTSFDWDNMTSDDIARLLLYCGQAVEMNYTESGSGAYNGDALSALVHIFGYDKGINGRQRLLYSDDEWEEMIYDELYAGFPIYYSAGNDKDDHAFVVDGYDNGRFHINWGWGGNSDGYFLLTGLATDENMSPYYKRQLGIFCMRPSSEENEVISSNIYCANNNSWDTVEIQREGSTTSFPAFRIGCELTTNVNRDMSLFIGYGLYDGDELVQVLSQDQHTFITSEKYTYSKTISISNEKELINGDYRIVAIFRNHENEAWKKTRRADGIFIRTIISNNSLSLQSRPCNNGSIEDYEDYGIHTIQGVTYQLYYERQRFFATVLPYQLVDKKTDVLPYEDTYKYTGKVDIPCEVSFQGNNFRVDMMDSQSFWYCDDLTSLSVCGISYYGDIWQCPKLSTINLQEGVYSWGAIRYCPSLKEIELPETFNQIPRGNFLENCEQLEVIRFKGKNLSFRAIPCWDKKSLPSLTDIYFPMETPPDLYNVTYKLNGDEIHESLGDVPPNPNAIIHIPIGTIHIYQQSQWKQWNFIEDLPGLSSNAVTWGYCHGYGVANRGQGCLSGDNNMEYAMLVPKEELEIYKDCQISQILVYSEQASKYDDGDEDYEYVFITKRGTDYLVKQTCKLIRGKWNTIQLEHPYTITGEELFVGMGRHSGLTVWYSDKDFTDEIFYSDTFWKREMGDDYTSTISIGTWQSRGYEPAVPLRFTIEGDKVPVGAAIKRLNVIEGSSINVQAEVHNKSLNTIRSYTIIWTAEDGQTRSQSYETSILPNADETIIIPLPSSLGKGTHSITFDITSVDGKANELMGLQARTIYIVNGKEGIVVKTHDYTREYGEKNPSFVVDIQGLTPNGTPSSICDATNVSPVGDYPIVTISGSITNENVVYMNGTLTITKAPLTITAKNYTIKQGETLPTFDASYTGFKNNETESVLTQKPTFTCSATPASSPGTYDITVSGAAAQNYDVSYVKGTLTITAPDSYVLTYIVNGEIYKTYEVEYGASITPEEEPTKEGCTFSGWSEIPTTMPAENVTVTGTFTTISQITIPGDANGDGGVNVFDVTATVNYILGSSNDGFDSDAADVNGDGTVNVFDVTKMVNIILGVDDASAKMRKAEGLSGTDKLYLEDFEIEPGEEKEVNILLDNPNAEYRDLQFDLYLPEGISVVQDKDEEFLVDTGSRCTKKHTIGFSYTDGHYVCMLYSTAKNPLTGNSGDILAITLKADEGVTPGVKTGSFRNVSLSKTDATGPTYDEFSFGINVKGDADRIEDVIANNGTYQIYTVDGQSVNTLQKGVNIIRYPNGTTKKVYVK